MPTTRRTSLAIPSALTVIAALAVTGCTQNAIAEAGSDQALQVTSTATQCAISATKAPAGTLTFSVKNAGDEVTEFYLLAEDGLHIVAEVENIGPGLTRDLVARVSQGSYFTACKPGMKGEGIRDEFTVTAGDTPVAAGSDAEAVERAEANYAAYVQDQSAQLLVKTKEFAAAYEAGDDEAARDLYPRARVHWERIETVAESFGDLDPLMDAREADLEPGQKRTGWHVMEKDLWPARAKSYTPLTKDERSTFARDLLANTETLDARVQELTFTLDQITNGARGLLDEVATGKVTGEEEYWSRTDLWDFQANVDGARVAFEGVKEIAERNDPELAGMITTRFAALQTLLDQQRDGDGFVSYDKLSPAQVKELSDAVNALSEPLSQLTAAVL